VAASDALVGEGLSISPWKEALAQRDDLRRDIEEHGKPLIAEMRNRAVSAEARLAKLIGKRCVWVPAKSFRHASCHATGCGDYFWSNYSNPTNMGYRFCPYCGGRIQVEGEK
jgi:hypothetical protein